MDPVTGICSVSPIPDEFRDPHPIDSMVHCDGLLLCMCHDRNCKRTRYVAPLAIWNPALRKIKWIETSVCYQLNDYYGIGYDKTVSRDNYKILRFWGSRSVRNFYKSDPMCEIYECKSDSWRTLKTKFDRDVEIQCKGVSVKGNMYWTAEKKEHFILSFDFSMETFKDICVCPPSSWVSRLAGFNEDRLSLLLQGVESLEIEVWMTNKLSDGVVSFSQYLNVTTPDLPPLHIHNGMAGPGYSIGKHRNIMVWCEGYVEENDKEYICIKFYEIDEGGIRKQIETGRHREFDEGGYDIPVFCSYVYVPSLIPIPVPE